MLFVLIPASWGHFAILPSWLFAPRRFPPPIHPDHPLTISNLLGCSYLDDLLCYVFLLYGWRWFANLYYLLHYFSLSYGWYQQSIICSSIFQYFEDDDNLVGRITHQPDRPRWWDGKIMIIFGLLAILFLHSSLYLSLSLLGMGRTLGK